MILVLGINPSRHRHDIEPIQHDPHSSILLCCPAQLSSSFCTRYSSQNHSRPALRTCVWFAAGPADTFSQTLKTDCHSPTSSPYPLHDLIIPHLCTSPVFPVPFFSFPPLANYPPPDFSTRWRGGPATASLDRRKQPRHLATPVCSSTHWTPANPTLAHPRTAIHPYLVIPPGTWLPLSLEIPLLFF